MKSFSKNESTYILSISTLYSIFRTNWIGIDRYDRFHIVRTFQYCNNTFCETLLGYQEERPKLTVFMITSSNENIVRVTGHLCGEFTGHRGTQRSVTRSFDLFFDLRPNERLSKQSWGWWFEMPSRPLWRHSNVSRHMCSGMPLAVRYFWSLGLVRMCIIHIQASY